jgi:uncharacterized protein
MLLRSLLILPLVLALVSCDRDRAMTTPNGSRLELPVGVGPVEFPAGRVWIETGEQVHELRVEVAHTPWQRERGLMYRSSMPDTSGMIFAYEEIQDAGSFWMFNTWIPLSIAYMDAEGTIRNIVDMEPCTAADRQRCPLYPSGVAFQYALEVNQGYFAERGIEAGDRVRYQPD